MLEIIPVLDLMNSVAVSGKSGNRNTYTPLQTIFSQDSNPIAIANNLKINGAKEIYIADLDLIEKKGHNLDTVKMLNTILPVMLDCGIKNLESFDFYVKFVNKIIVATETLDSIEELHKIFDKFPKERIVISLDIKNDKILSNNLDISLNDFKRELATIGPNEIILLDISKVGTENGFNKELLNNFSEFKDKIILGGGLTNEELHSLDEFGIKKVLVGSALHKGDVKLNF
jgi:phosphoribosylformimino-5-aminoimidazole carboxamide ribotide isomerase